ncbi:MAG: tyrosine-type recombinase/integrase [Eubacteriales bacterium]|nr:tyrosine-type recombinase/integrase [Eubacteriales bacterium]
MATITKRMTKSGLTYRIQVKLKDKGSGKLNAHSITWKPPAGLTPKQIEREVIIYADKYESDLRMSLTSSDAQGISTDTLLGEYAEWWLERRKGEISASYYMNCKVALEDIVGSIGGYKLRELNPTIIQRFYDQLDKKEKTITVVTAKPELREAMKKTNKGYTRLTEQEGFNSATLCAALAGKHISYDYAKRLSDCLGRNVNSIFTVAQRKEPYAYETIHKIKRTLRAILSTAKKQRIIRDNYASADYITFPKRPPHQIDYMNDEDAKKFYAAADACTDIRYKTATLILLLTGLRRGELCGLEWSDIDLEAATLTVARSVTTVAGFGVVEKEPKTESSKRVIAISDKLIAVLGEYRSWYEQYRYDFGDRWQGTDRLFVSEDGGRIYPGTIDSWVHRICDAAGLPRRTVHSLRHTNITMQIAAGVPLVTVSGRAGHARTSTTTDIYSHFLKSSDKTAAEKIEQLFE